MSSRTRIVAVLLVGLLALAASAGSLVAWPAASQAADDGHVFLVNDLTFDTVDANRGDGFCRTSDPNRCTLRAAIEEANALAAAGDTTPVTIAVVTSGMIVVTGMGVLASNAMYNDLTALSPYDAAGAYYWITAPNLTIDFGGISGVKALNDVFRPPVFYVDAPGVTIQGFTNLYGAETSIIVSAAAPGFLLRNGSVSNHDDGERLLYPRSGASNITLRDVHVGDLYGQGVIQLPAGTVTGLTLDRVLMDNLPGQGHYYAIYGASSCTLVNLTITNSTFTGFKSGRSVLRLNNVALDGARIEGNQFLSNYSGSEPVIYIATRAVGRPSVIRGNVFNNSSGNVTQAIQVAMGMAANSQNLLSITDNYFVGFTSNTVHLTGVGAMSVVRNRFGNPSFGRITADSETTGYTLMYNSHSSANSQIRTWYPTGYGPVPNECAIYLVATAPTRDAKPTIPVTLDVYYTAGTTAEVHLSRVTGVSATDTVIHVPYPLGSGKVRFQTIDATGRSSQYSQTYTVSAVDTCAPAVTVEQAATQPDPTSRRDIEFHATFTEPVSAPTIDAFSLAGSTAPGARVTAVEQLDPVTYAVTVRVDGAGVAQLSLPAGSVQDSAGNGNTASNTDEDAAGTPIDNTVTYVPPIALGPVTGTVSIEGCASYPIVLVEDSVEGYPVVVQPISIALTPSAPELVTLDPNPAVIGPRMTSVTVQVCPAEGARPPNGTLTVAHVISSGDLAFDGLLIGSASVPMEDIVAHWRLTATASPESGHAVAVGQVITVTLTMEHVSGRQAQVAITEDLTGLLDDATWQPGSVTISNAGTPVAGASSLAPDAEGRLTLPTFALAPGTRATITFQATALPPGAGDMVLTTSAAAAGPEPPDPCDADDPSDTSCWLTTHTLAAVSVIKTGPVTVIGGQIADAGQRAPADQPADIAPGEVTWAYTVANIGSAPMTGLAVTDDQGVDVACPTTRLTPGAAMVCLGTGVVSGATSP